MLDDSLDLGALHVDPRTRVGIEDRGKSENAFSGVDADGRFPDDGDSVFGVFVLFV